jgi:cyclophilin family peptidyl-prolyl cis-trans isomerase
MTTGYYISNKFIVLRDYLKIMKTFQYLLISCLLFAGFLITCSQKQAESTTVLIETDFGNIKIRLYNETPLHKENFIKLVQQGYYNGLLFHRVINNFMIQGGDPSSLHASDTSQLGSGDPGYTIPPEIVNGLFHKRGVIAAARELDANNPERRSSGSQFYIVDGHTFTDDELDKTERKINQNIFQNQVGMFFAIEKDSLINRGLPPLYDTIIIHATNFARKKFIPFSFSEEQRTFYKTIGGSPHLDGSFTIFGETVEGFEVIDKIAAIETDKNDRPLRNIKMKITLIK